MAQFGEEERNENKMADVASSEWLIKRTHAEEMQCIVAEWSGVGS